MLMGTMNPPYQNRLSLFLQKGITTSTKRNEGRSHLDIIRYSDMEHSYKGVLMHGHYLISIGVHSGRIPGFVHS